MVETMKNKDGKALAPSIYMKLGYLDLGLPDYRDSARI